MSRDDDRDRERPKLSFSERDRRLRERGASRGEPRPRGPAAEAKSRAATGQYLKEIGDRLFAKGKGGAEGERLAKSLRDAHGTPALADACRSYRDALGLPEEPSLLQLFLDARDPELVVAALGALGERRAAGGLQPSAGLRSQVRLLAQDPDDAVAEAAEALLERL